MIEVADRDRDQYQVVLVKEKHRDKVEQLREQLEYADGRRNRERNETDEHRRRD